MRLQIPVGGVERLPDAVEIGLAVSGPRGFISVCADAGSAAVVTATSASPSVIALFVTTLILIDAIHGDRDLICIRQIFSRRGASGRIHR